MDRKFRLARKWSNVELKKFAHHFTGRVVNVSGWKDEDKEGEKYRSYFTGASSYTITNYKSEARGFQGTTDEIFLDLEQELPDDLKDRFDVVFNHTTLEHIYQIQKAFSNICAMSKDIVIIVVPFLQEMHGEYGDFWRFSPQVMKKLFERNKLELLYLTFNTDENASIYIFTIASRKPQNWEGIIPKIIMRGLGKNKEKEVIGYNVVKNPTKEKSIWKRILDRLKFDK